ncbi:MAG: sulfatase [Opitutaceae bacterium]|nr:sulfatase [Opitutaceae bacterium]
MNRNSSRPCRITTFCALFLIGVILQGTAARGARPLNLVVLYADDWRHDTLGAAGHAVVKTPHLDRLAAQGVRFTHNYVTTSICGVSRATLFTGQWMSRHGNSAFGAFKTPWEETYPGMLRSHGYHVGHVGKWHNGKFPGDRFDFGRSYSGTYWMTAPDGSKIHVTQKNEDDSLEFLRSRPREKPFCLTLAFFATHAEDQNPLQYLPQPASLARYEGLSIPVPPTATDEAFRRLPAFLANEKNEGRNRWHWRFDTPEKYQTMMKNYYRLVTEVDAVCGRVMEELRRQGVLEQTLVIFTGDNGYFHGEHGLADKWYPYEESIRTPLIVWDPRLPADRRGRTNGSMTLNTDLAPTLLAAAGLPAPPHAQGSDLSPLYLTEPHAAWRTEFFYEHATLRDPSFIPSSEALVRKEEKYILWPDFGREQYFALRDDPYEQNDRIGDPALQSRIADLRRRFAELKTAAR